MRFNPAYGEVNHKLVIRSTSASKTRPLLYRSLRGLVCGVDERMRDYALYNRVPSGDERSQSVQHYYSCAGCIVMFMYIQKYVLFYICIA